MINVHSKEFKDSLKKILAGYTSWTPKIYNELRDLGFEIDDKRKHAILKINVDGKTFVFSISKTPSDKRAGMNNASIIYRTIMKG